MPDTIEAIEAGRQEQRKLFVEQPDDSRAGRLARILGTVPGVVTGDRIHNPVAYPRITEENAVLSSGVANSVAADYQNIPRTVD